jgi:hypothetical protein
MDAKKRERMRGALERRRKDVEKWTKLEDSIAHKTDQRDGFTSKKEKAIVEVAILQSRLGVS